MCLIVSKNKGVALPKEECLENAAQNNPDGIGIALHKEGSNEIIIKKDFTGIYTFLGWLHNNVSINDSVIIHFRVATSGLKDEGNRHPFPITKNKELLRETNLVCQSAVAHNGVLIAYDKHVTYSDTQKFILDILSDDEIKNNLANPVIQKLLNNFLSHDRLAIMLSDGTQILLGEFNVNDGISYSAYSYKWHWQGCYGKNYVTPYNYGSKWEWCEGCLQSQQDVRQLKFKKAVVRLCKPCRKNLILGRLDKLVEEKTNVTNSGCVDLLSYSNSARCRSCTTYINRGTAYSPAFGIYYCVECVKNMEKIPCDTCGVDNKPSEMIAKDNYLICIVCDLELNKCENPIVQAQVIESKKDEINEST